MIVLNHIILKGVSIPLKSGRCCKQVGKGLQASRTGLNPFEVREVLQENKGSRSGSALSLNPFEVREVLQEFASRLYNHALVSIPLKSGRCCKTFYLDDGTVIPSQSL